MFTQPTLWRLLTILLAILGGELGMTVALAQNEKSDARFFDDPDLLVKEKLAPLEKAGQHREAIAEARKWIEAGVDQAAVHNFEGWQHIALKDYDKAIAAFTRALAKDPMFQQSLLGRGSSYDRTEKYEAALADYKNTPASSSRSSNLGVLNLKLHRPFPALLWLDDFRYRSEQEENTADIFQAHVMLAEAWKLLAANDREVWHLTKALEISPDATTYEERAFANARWKKWDAAFADMNKAIELAENKLRHEAKYIQLLVGNKQFKAAIDFANSLVKKYPNVDGLRELVDQRIGEIRERQAKHETAPEPDFDRRAAISTASRKMQEENYFHATLLYSDLIINGDWEYYVARAKAISQAGLPALALQDLDAAIAAGLDDNGEVHSLRAYALHSQRQPDDQAVVAAYSRARELGFTLPSDLILRALHYKNQQKFAEALADYKLANETIPPTTEKSKMRVAAEMKHLQLLVEAQRLLKPFVAADADYVALTRPLLPSAEIIAKVYSEPFSTAIATELKARLEELPDKIAIAPQPGQTQLLVYAANSEELLDENEFSDDFPGGYRQVAHLMKPGLTFVCFKFVKPGKSLGMAYDGLVKIDGQWYWLPKPWRYLPAEKSE